MYGFIVNLFVGVTYAWSVISHHLIYNLDWTVAEANAPFTAYASLTSILFIIAGGLRDKFGARLTLCIGVTLFSLGVFLSGETSSSFELIISFSLISGIGSSLCLSSIVPTVLLETKPKERPKASGLIVSGFAISPLFFAPLLTLSLTKLGFQHTLELTGLVTLIVTLPLAWKLTTNNKRHSVVAIKANQADSPLLKTLQTRSYYAIWIAKVAIMGTAFMFIGNIINVAYSLTSTPNLFYLTSLFALANFTGRITSGFLVEKVGESTTILTLLFVQALNLIFFIEYQSHIFLSVGVAVAGYCFGGSFGLLPALVANKFGLKHFGVNWGSTSLAAAAGSYLAHLLVDVSHQAYGDYTLTLLALAGSNLGALIFFKFNFTSIPTST